jgi:hypothetical protein
LAEGLVSLPKLSDDTAASKANAKRAFFFCLTQVYDNPLSHGGLKSWQVVQIQFFLFEQLT